jgi:hypothetical protein
VPYFVFDLRTSREELQLGDKKNCNQKNLAENGTQPLSWDESVLTKHIRGVNEAKNLAATFCYLDK